MKNKDVDMASEHFSKALSDFVSDVSSGDAIRHLADLGYTVSEIHDRLDYPTPPEKIADIVWKHFIKTGVICLEEPGEAPREKISYVREYDSLGRASFRQVKESLDPEPGSGSARYAECDFGIRKYRNKEEFEESLQVLEPRDREYVLSLPWPIQKVWHIEDERMKRIQAALKG